jgi:glycosyltransferase involved in cell wall biosynthesis
MNAPERTLYIAVVTETYTPDINGVAMTCERMVSGLSRRGHRIQLVRTQDPKAPIAEHVDEDIRVRGFAVPWYPDVRFGLITARRLIRAWTKDRPDIVQVVTEGPLGLAALRAARKLGIPAISDFHTLFDHYTRYYKMGWMQGMAEGYLRWFHHQSLATLVPTNALRETLAAHGYHDLKVIGRGVDTERFAPAHRSSALRKTWGVDDDTPVALYVGRLAAEKNLDLAIEAWHAMRSAHPGCRMLFVGDGPMRQALEAAAPEALFVGSKKGAELSAHYASADIFLFPSLSETFGNVTQEAMASGLAVLAFDHAAAGTLIQPGQNGLLATPGDNSTFINQAVHLVNDAGMRQRFGRQARQDALTHDWNEVTIKLEELLMHYAEQREVTAA